SELWPEVGIIDQRGKSAAHAVDVAGSNHPAGTFRNGGPDGAIARRHYGQAMSHRLGEGHSVAFVAGREHEEVGGDVKRFQSVAANPTVQRDTGGKPVSPDDFG